MKNMIYEIDDFCCQLCFYSYVDNYKNTDLDRTQNDLSGKLQEMTEVKLNNFVHKLGE